jgi:NAD(P)-dependent dehydrogenase (short-subunit alcohol dehydrogenase family)
MMPNEEWGLVGKVAIVTGGSAADDGIGNGRAAAILLARAGAHVLVVDRDLTLAERTVAMIAADGGNAVAASYDATSSCNAPPRSMMQCLHGVVRTASTSMLGHA